MGWIWQMHAPRSAACKEVLLETKDKRFRCLDVPLLTSMAVVQRGKMPHQSASTSSPGMEY